MEISREQYLISQSLLNGIRAADTCFCGNHDSDTMSNAQMKQIAQLVAADATTWQIENGIALLSKIKEVKDKSIGRAKEK